MRTRSVKNILERLFVIICVCIILSGSSIIIYFAYFEPEDTASWDGHSLEEVLSTFEEQRSMFAAAADILISNDQFWSESGLPEGDVRAWIVSPSDVEKLSLFTQADQELLQEFFHRTKPYKISLTQSSLIEFQYSSKEKKDAYTVAYFHSDKALAMSENTYDLTWFSNKSSLTDLGDNWYFYYEDGGKGADDTPETSPVQEKIIDAPFLSQLPDFPSGCESVSTVMALNYAGIDISVDTFIDQYLDTSSGALFDPDVTFGGDPRSVKGYGCYMPVISNAVNKLLAGTSYYARTLGGIPLSSLCTDYIDKDIPVVIWATQEMAAPRAGRTWTFEGKTIQWISPMHCLLLVGYNEDAYIFNDPLQSGPLTYYSKASVEAAYAGLSQQAIVILEK